MKHSRPACQHLRARKVSGPIAELETARARETDELIMLGMSAVRLCQVLADNTGVSTNAGSGADG